MIIINIDNISDYDKCDYDYDYVMVVVINLEVTSTITKTYETEKDDKVRKAKIFVQFSEFV